MLGEQKSPGAAATATKADNVNSFDYSHYTESPANKLLARLDRAKETGRGQYMALCPAHDDGSPSLSVRETSDGTLLVHCFAECQTADVMAAVGLTMADLFPDSGRRARSPMRRHERRHDLRTVFSGIAYEIQLAALIVSDVKENRSCDQATFDRLATAARRINAARGLL